MPEAPKVSLGYPHVEKLIDSEDFDEVNRSFQAAYQQLDKLAKEKGGVRKSQEARAAMRALEKCSELLKELLKVKYRLQEELKAKAKK